MTVLKVMMAFLTLPPTFQDRMINRGARWRGKWVMEGVADLSVTDLNVADLSVADLSVADLSVAVVLVIVVIKA
jgi:hypothetical protein